MIPHEFGKVTCPLMSVFPNKIIYSNHHSLELNGRNSMRSSQVGAMHQEKWFLPFLALYPNRDSMGYISIYMHYSCNLSDIELDFHYIL
jgi:hypothetical protein